jgi:hypothetical protein
MQRENHHPGDGCTFLREADVLRADKTLSRVMLRRKLRLYTDRLELFHEREKSRPELEVVANLRGSQVSDVHAVENDIKPTGTNLFVSYVYGSIQSTTVVWPLDLSHCISRATNTEDLMLMNIKKVKPFNLSDPLKNYKSSVRCSHWICFTAHPLLL